FLRSNANCFDFGVTLISLAVSIFVFVPNEYNEQKAVKFAVFLRSLRLLRFCEKVPVISILFETFIRILPAVKTYVELLLCTMFFYSCLGLEIFGGKISTNPDSPYFQKLVGTDYAEQNYWPFNFNDMASGMVTLFEILVVSGWHTVAEGHEAVTDIWAKVYFSSFYILGVLICSNIVIAIVLDRYMEEYTRVDQKIIVEGEAEVSKSRATFDASSITGTTTGIEGTFIVRVEASQGRCSINETLDDNALLEKVFTKECYPTTPVQGGSSPNARFETQPLLSSTTEELNHASTFGGEEDSK
ncbi:hypothetical protein CYMTET_52866, partial [Cymbomonas tetramitiformis]